MFTTHQLFLLFFVVMVDFASSSHLRKLLHNSTFEEFPQSPYKFSCTREARLHGRCRWCSRDAPSNNGVWYPFPPYWQFPGECHNQAFDVDDTRKCLTGRTLYVIGNSVSRQAAFNIVEMLGGNPVKREDQRDQCPKHEITWGDSCHQEIEGVKIKYLFLQFFDGFDYTDRNGFPYFRYKTKSDIWTTGKLAYNETTIDGKKIVTRFYNKPNDLDADKETKYFADDNCIKHSMRSCLRKFFEGSKSSDVLIFNVGMAHVVRPHGVEPEHSPGIDIEAWLTNSASAFQGHLAATFNGQVFRTTLAEFNMWGNLASTSPYLKIVNEILWRSWAPSGEDRPWYTIDQWPINQGRYHLYNDHVHFNGPLTVAMLTQVLNELCPGGGKTTWSYPVGDNNLVDNSTLVLSIPMSVHVNRFEVLYQGTRHKIPDMDTFYGLNIHPDQFVVITNELAATLPEGEMVPACDVAKVPNVCMDSIYYKALHGILRVSS